MFSLINSTAAHPSARPESWLPFRNVSPTHLTPSPSPGPPALPVHACPKPTSSPSQEPCQHLSTSSLTHPLSSLFPAPHPPVLPFPSDCRHRCQALGQCQPFLASLPFLSASPMSPVPPWPHRAPGWACPRRSPVTTPHHPHARSLGGPLSGWTPTPLPPGLCCVWGPTKCLQSPCGKTRLSFSPRDPPHLRNQCPATWSLKTKPAASPAGPPPRLPGLPLPPRPLPRLPHILQPSSPLRATSRLSFPHSRPHGRCPRAPCLQVTGQ